MNKEIIELLFKTKAIQACPEGEPFFYTSGKLGPYYINTHFLFGSKSQAEKYLTEIEEFRNDLKTFPGKIYKSAYRQYLNSKIYKTIIDLICEKVKEYDIDYISGGERRDFFFSILPASFLGIPHISILKDKTTIISTPDFRMSHIGKPNELSGKKVLHIADLVTEASSYIRAWIPALKSLGCDFNDTISIVDRNQGGKEQLKKEDISLFSFTSIEKELFIKAKKDGYITGKQYDMISLFVEDPDRFMFEFLDDNPKFLDKKIRKGGKIKDRAILCKEIYVNKKEE